MTDLKTAPHRRNLPTCVPRKRPAVSRGKTPMSSPGRFRIPALALLFIVMIVPPLALFAALPWLRQQPRELALLLTGVTGMLTVLASVALAVLHDRSIDEWHRSNARFSSQWGWTVGACLFSLLLALPPIHDLIISGAEIWGGSPNPDTRLVLTTFTFGFMAVVFTQAFCTLLLSLGWGFWMSRGVRNPS